jgi:hypothetical protein
MPLKLGETFAVVINESMMEITKKSPVTGKENKLLLPITEDQFNRWIKGELIQNAMPHLSINEREFLISGCIDNDWAILTTESHF